ncbi:hypothetical protein [Desulfovibrio gilichinskyi]|uniref:Uncharacterized protein n=1 Tax=Desulfovibrio gilichinskyi TaxID=1519643 RepID=A0A1X7C3C4_9BACT|nr:hypothetical protein [Desulfovibrio gilichinskyi]SME89299.1 hypothetical protein SAMN06295933_0268 [Desulfovibrio gilichinskyi]
MIGRDKGMQKIRGVLGKFSSMMKELEEGMNILRQEKQKNEAEVAGLNERNAAIDSEVESAEGVYCQLDMILKGGAVSQKVEDNG